MTIQTIGVGHKQRSAFRRFARLCRNADKLKQSRLDSNTKHFNGVVADTKRQDSTYAGGSGLHLARDLEHKYTEVMRDDYPENNALELFPMDRSVPAGAQKHTVKRITAQGRPRVHGNRGGDIPTVSVSADEETFNVLYYVLGVEWDYFDELASGFAGSALLDELLLAARDAMLEFWNEKVWFGDEENGMYGVLNYPYINKYVLGATVFTAGGDAAAMLSELQAMVDFVGELNKGKGILRPNRLVISVRMLQIIEGAYFTGVTGETVLSRLKTSKGIEVVSAWEMQGTGPGGTDQCLLYKSDDKRSIANVVPIPYTQLPVQGPDVFDYSIPTFMAHGGVIMRKALMNIIGYATVVT